MNVAILETTYGPVTVVRDGLSSLVHLNGRLVGQYTQMREMRVRAVPVQGRAFYTAGWAEAAERLAEMEAGI